MAFYINKKGYKEGAIPLTFKALRASTLTEITIHTKPIPRNGDFRLLFPAACVILLKLTGNKATIAEVKAGEWNNILRVTTYPSGAPITTWKVLLGDSVSIIEV